MTDVGPGSTDPNSPTPVTSGDWSVTSYDSAEGPLYYEFTSPVDCFVRADTLATAEMSGSEAGGNITLPTVTVENGSTTSDVRFFATAGQPVQLSVSLFASTKPISEASAYDMWLGMYREYYADFAAFEAVIITFYGSEEEFLDYVREGFGPDFPISIPGNVTGVVRFNSVTDYGAGEWFTTSEGVEDWESVALGRVSDNYPPPGYFNGGVGVGGAEATGLLVTDYWSRSGSRSITTVNKQDMGWTPSSDGFGVGASRDRRQRTEGAIWAYLNHNYATGPYWHINDYYQVHHGLMSPGALDYGFSINTNGRGGASPFVADTMHFFMERVVNSPWHEANTWIDTGVSPWDRWLRYSCKADMVNSVFVAEIADESDVLWSYTTSLTGFTADGADVDDASIAGTLGRFSSYSSSVPHPTEADRLSWNDDHYWKTEYWLPSLPPLLPIPAPEIEDDGPFARAYFIPTRGY